MFFFKKLLLYIGVCGLSGKGLIVNIFGVEGPMVSVETTHPHSFNVKAAMDKT